MIDPLDVRCVNCARCDLELLGESMRGHTLPWTCDGMEFVADRVNQRPYCQACLDAIGAERRSAAHSFVARCVSASPRSAVEDDDPWEQLGVRILEDGDGEA